MKEDDHGKIARDSFDDRTAAPHPISRKDAHPLHIGILRESDPAYEAEAAGGVTRGEHLLAVAVLAKAAEDAVRWRYSQPTLAMAKERNVGRWASCCENVPAQKEVRCRCDPVNPAHEFRAMATMDAANAEKWIRETMIGEDVGTAGGWVDVCGANSVAFLRDIVDCIERGIMPNGTGSYAAEAAHGAEGSENGLR